MSEQFKICSNKECGKLLPLNEFKLVKSRKKQYYHSLCLNCYRKKDKEYKKKKYSDPKYREKAITKSKNYSLKNKESISIKNKEKHKKYYAKNKEKILASTKKYYQENKEWYKEYRQQYEKTHPRKNRKRNRSLIDKIRSSISRSISKKIKKMGETKIDSIIKYLDFNFNELKLHIESQFESWMNWDNFGKYDPKTWNDNDSSTWKWQIDHIIPHSEFKYASMEENSFKECWKLNNLRPYSAKQNVLDGCYRVRHKEKKDE